MIAFVDLVLLNDGVVLGVAPTGPFLQYMRILRREIGSKIGAVTLGIILPVGIHISLLPLPMLLSLRLMRMSPPELGSLWLCLPQLPLVLEVEAADDGQNDDNEQHAKNNYHNLEPSVEFHLRLFDFCIDVAEFFRRVFILAVQAICILSLMNICRGNILPLYVVQSDEVG